MSPTDLLARARALLAAGVADRDHPARKGVLATIGPDGAQARTVVLRRMTDRDVDMHTDAASPKVAQLRADPRAELTFWVPDDALQIRLSLRVAILTGTEATTVWDAMPPAARANYGGSPHPGQPLNGAPHVQDANLARFAVLRGAVKAFDILHLGQPHRRASFRAEDGFAGVWVAP